MNMHIYRRVTLGIGRGPLQTTSIERLLLYARDHTCELRKQLRQHTNVSIITHCLDRILTLPHHLHTRSLGSNKSRRSLLLCPLESPISYAPYAKNALQLSRQMTDSHNMVIDILLHKSLVLILNLKKSQLVLYIVLYILTVVMKL